MLAVIGFVADLVFPISPLPDAPFALGYSARIGRIYFIRQIQVADSART